MQPSSVTSQIQRDFDARQLDLFGYKNMPVQIEERVLKDGKMEARKVTVYPEDFIYDPLSKRGFD